MRKFLSVFFGLILWGVGAVSLATPKFEIKGEINGKLRPTIARMMVAIAENPDQIDLDIDSPGGYVSVGLEVVKLIEEAQKKDIKVVCTVSGKMAASMAFVIFTACSKRYVSKDAKLLAHDIATVLPGLFGAWINRQGAIQLAKDLQAGQDELELIIRKTFNPSDKVYRYLSDNEVFWGGEDGNVYCPGFIDGFVPSTIKKEEGLSFQMIFGQLRQKYGTDHLLINN